MNSREIYKHLGVNMKRILFSIYSILFTFILTLLLFLSMTGCVYSNQASYPEEKLIVYGGIDGASYVYSNKVDVTVYADNGKYMNLTLKCYKSDEVWSGDGYQVFDKLKYKYFAWNNYYLYIQAEDNVYYSLDIKGYEPGKFVNSKEKTPKYTLKKYTDNEFKNSHPNYKTYEWLDG